MKNVIRQYLDFIAGPYSNIYLEDDHLRVYVRKGRHLIDGHLVTCLDIGNVTNIEFDDYDEELGTYVSLHHQGHFRDFMQFVETHNPYGIIYVESVISKRMEEILHKNGYVPSTHENCYHKFVGTHTVGSTDAT